eukprot:TRINITY_DN35068_c0_g1_i1.p1 TRINITY_DN35068_c0_g1~~TRINITY_DN35068_c0_g1_i1.p1  ORF type:complete len:291 (-),score=104.34 TRINITY_DN35068_c0_g1_i1:46-855(-)
MPALCSKYYNPKVTNTATKNLSKHMEKMVVADRKRQEKEEARMGPRTTPKHPILYDNNRTKVFNRKFFESVGLVMSQIPELLGKGIIITKVNVRQDFAEVRVFWVSKEDEEVSQLLESTSKRIRKGMAENAGLGQLPKIVFVLDTNYMMTTHMDKLFDKMDLGPDIETEENIWLEVEQLELGSDACGLRRNEILGTVELALMKSKAIHRVQYSEEQFKTAYRETIERHGGARKIEVKSNIKKFLVSRKKAAQRAKEENQTIAVDFGQEH